MALDMLRARRMRFAYLVLVCASSVDALAQTLVRPTPPAGGHATSVDLAVPVVYSDGYQTFGSMILPAGAAPSCGWPLVVHVHPFGQSRGFDLGLQTMLAGQGYAVWSYDVRAHGQAIALNTQHAQAGTTFWGPHERCDLAEQIHFVGAQAQWTGVVDTTRVGVLGSSQGGAHAWLAAAWSGETLDTPGRPPIVFPTIACVVPMDFVAETIDTWLRDGRLFSSWFVEAIAGAYTGVPFDAAFLQTCRGAFVAQDPAPMASMFASEDRVLAARLAASPVPVLYSHAYLDLVDSPLSTIVRLETLTAPHRAVLSTIGHDVPDNLVERELRHAMILRWLHRWLWSEANEVELEPQFVLAELPLRQTERDDPLTLWNRAHRATVATPATAARWWLHDDFALRETEPVAPQIDAVVAQTIDPLAVTFTAQDYLDQPAVRAVPNVLAACPLQEHVYTLTTTAETQLAASATWHAELVPHHAEWMLAALLTVQPADPGADEVLLASGALSSRTSSPGIAETHDLRLPPIAVRIPAGATIRLRIRNLWLRELPMAQRLEVAPLFHDFRVDVVHGDPVGSWLELPLEPVAPRLVVDRTWLDLATPQPLLGRVRAGEAHGGHPYFVAVGLSGQVPGVPYLNDVVPIDGDWLVAQSAGSSEAPYYSGFLGFLDAAGEAPCSFDLSTVALPQGLNGYRLTLVAFVWDGQWAPTGAAANACDVWLR
jgi:hypothetical protein